MYVFFDCQMNDSDAEIMLILLKIIYCGFQYITGQLMMLLSGSRSMLSYLSMLPHFDLTTLMGEYCQGQLSFFYYTAYSEYILYAARRPMKECTNLNYERFYKTHQWDFKSHGNIYKTFVLWTKVCNIHVKDHWGTICCLLTICRCLCRVLIGPFNWICCFVSAVNHDW